MKFLIIAVILTGVGYYAYDPIKSYFSPPPPVAISPAEALERHKKAVHNQMMAERYEASAKELDDQLHRQHTMTKYDFERRTKEIEDLRAKATAIRSGE